MEAEVSCTSRDETLSAYVDGELGQRERLRVEAHLDSCARCRQEAARFSQLAALVREAGEEEIAALPEVSLWPGIAGEVGDGRGVPGGGLLRAWRNRAPVWARPAWVPVAIAAALVITLALPFVRSGDDLQADEAIVESVDEGDVMVLRQGKNSIMIWVFDE